MMDVDSNLFEMVSTTRLPPLPAQASEEYFEKNGEPLFSSHMLDLSEESLEDNIAICKKYLERMAKINLLLEMELGVWFGFIFSNICLCLLDIIGH